MNGKVSVVAVLACWCVLPPLGCAAEKQPTEIESLRREIAELRQLAAQLIQRLEALEQRVFELGRKTRHPLRRVLQIHGGTEWMLRQRSLDIEKGMKADELQRRHFRRPLWLGDQSARGSRRPP